MLFLGRTWGFRPLSSNLTWVLALLCVLLFSRCSICTESALICQLSFLQNAVQQSESAHEVLALGWFCAFFFFFSSPVSLMISFGTHLQRVKSVNTGLGSLKMWELWPWPGLRELPPAGPAAGLLCRQRCLGLPWELSSPQVAAAASARGPQGSFEKPQFWRAGKGTVVEQQCCRHCGMARRGWEFVTCR